MADHHRRGFRATGLQYPHPWVALHSPVPSVNATQLNSIQQTPATPGANSNTLNFSTRDPVLISVSATNSEPQPLPCLATASSRLITMANDTPRAGGATTTSLQSLQFSGSDISPNSEPSTDASHLTSSTPLAHTGVDKLYLDLSSPPFQLTSCLDHLRSLSLIQPGVNVPCHLINHNYINDLFMKIDLIDLRNLEFNSKF